MKHTPGPWTIGDVMSLNSFPIMTGKILLAYFNQSGNNEDEGNANAALIAAAPELLAALKELMNTQQELDHIQYRQFLAAREAATAAIAKAEGINQ